MHNWAYIYTSQIKTYVRNVSVNCQLQTLPVIVSIYASLNGIQGPGSNLRFRMFIEYTVFDTALEKELMELQTTAFTARLESALLRNFIWLARVLDTTRLRTHLDEVCGFMHVRR
jgi:hypothetical protein